MNRRYFTPVRNKFKSSRIVGIIHEHQGYLSPEIWGGFAIYPNSLRKGFSQISNSPVSNLISAGDQIMKDLQIQSKTSIYSKIKIRMMPDTLFNQIRSAFLNYNPNRETIIYHHMNSFTLPPFWLLKIAQDYNLRMITSIIDFQEHEHPEFLGKAIYDQRQKNYEVTLNLASGFVTASPFLVDSANRYFGIPEDVIKVAPLGWDHMPPLSEIQSKSIYELVDVSKPYFVFPSKAWAHKGHYELISYFKDLQNKLNLVLVGGLGSQTKSLEAAIRDTGQETSISILGYQSEIDLYALMYNSKGLVFPSIYEGFGLPYVEAAHLRTPVIAFENDSVNNLLGKSSAYLHSPGDYRNLISSLPFALVDPNRKAIIDSAFSKTENLTWENTARKTSEIYNLALG